MSLDFMVINKGNVNYRKCFMSMPFEEELRGFLSSSFYGTTQGGSLLLALDEYDDTLLSNQDIEILLKFCSELLQDFQVIYDYTIFDYLKAEGIKQQDIVNFAQEFHELLLYSLKYNKAVYAIGD